MSYTEQGHLPEGQRDALAPQAAVLHEIPSNKTQKTKGGIRSFSLNPIQRRQG